MNWLEIQERERQRKKIEVTYVLDYREEICRIEIIIDQFRRRASKRASRSASAVETAWAC